MKASARMRKVLREIDEQAEIVDFYVNNDQMRYECLDRLNKLSKAVEYMCIEHKKHRIRLFHKFADGKNCLKHEKNFIQRIILAFEYVFKIGSFRS